MRIVEALNLGQKYLVKLTTEREYSSGNTAPYPGWYGNYIPVIITGEYPRFYICDVLPHLNIQSYGSSSLYPITIDKWDIEQGIFKLYVE